MSRTDDGYHAALASIHSGARAWDEYNKGPARCWFATHNALKCATVGVPQIVNTPLFLDSRERKR